MDPIQEILSLLGQSEITDEHTARLNELYASLDDSQLGELESALSDEFDRVRSEDITAEAVAHLTNIADAVDGIRTIAETRIAEAAATAEALVELEARVHVQADITADETVTPEIEAEAETVEVADEAPVLVDASTETEVTPVANDETVEATEAAIADIAPDDLAAVALVAADAAANAVLDAGGDTDNADTVAQAVNVAVVDAATEGADTTAAEVVETPADELAVSDTINDEAITAESTTEGQEMTEASAASKEQIMANTPKQFAAEDTRPRVAIKAAGGGNFETTGQIEEALIERFRDLAGTGRQGVGRFRVATIEASAPEARRLADNRVTDVTDMVSEISQAVATKGGAESLVADGGLCAPVDVYYGLETIAQASRPLRDSITNFVSKRGGIQFVRPLSLADIGAATTPTPGNAIGVVTEAQDAASSVNKSNQMIACGALVEKRIDAVYNNLRFGNFMARTFPERTSQFTDLSIAKFAQFSEQRLFNAMAANSTPVFAPQKLGASRDLITALNRAAINYRARHRMPVNARIDVVLPAWVGEGLVSDDQVNALQSFGEQFTYTTAWIEARLGERNINVLNWFQDDYTTATVSGGALNPYPTTFAALLFHPGAHVYVDNGTLDLGVYRDSTMIADNVFGTFSEEFWTTAMWGLESLKINFSLCANGASAGSVDPKCGS